MSTFRMPILTSVALVIVLLDIARIEVAARQCFSDSECRRRSSTSKYCCQNRSSYFSGNRICRSNCVGYSCRSNSDCASGECCNKNACGSVCKLSGGAVAAIIIGAIIAIATPISICVCCRYCCSEWFLAQPGGAGMTVVSNSQYTQNMEAGSSYPVASYPSAPGYPAPLRNPNLHNPYPQKPGQVQPPQQITPGPPPSYSTQWEHQRRASPANRDWVVSRKYMTINFMLFLQPN